MALGSAAALAVFSKYPPPVRTVNPRAIDTAVVWIDRNSETPLRWVAALSCCICFEDSLFTSFRPSKDNDDTLGTYSVGLLLTGGTLTFP